MGRVGTLPITRLGARGIFYEEWACMGLGLCFPLPSSQGVSVLGVLQARPLSQGSKISLRESGFTSEVIEALKFPAIKIEFSFLIKNPRNCL
jgi:hypothetical protein